MDVGRRGLAPVGTGACSEEGAASTKEIPAGEGIGEVRLGRRAANQFNGFGLGRLASGREPRTVPGWSGRYGWVSRGTLGGGLGGAHIGGAHIGGIGNVLVPRRMESGKDFAADGTGAIKRGMLPTTDDTERGGDVAATQNRLLKAPFRAALVSTCVGRAVMEESADRAGLCLFFT